MGEDEISHIRAWAASSKLNQNTVNELLKLGFTCMDALELVLPEDLATTDIPVGQQKLLLHCIKKRLAYASTENGQQQSLVSSISTVPDNIASVLNNTGSVTKLDNQLNTERLQVLQQESPNSCASVFVTDNLLVNAKTDQGTLFQDCEDTYLDIVDFVPNFPILTPVPKQQVFKRNRGSPKYASHAPDGKIICKNFNSSPGCNFVDCKFAHVCSIPGCWSAHPVPEHVQIPLPKN